MTTPFYITTAINYPNGRPHVGHAYEAICADAIARFRRLEGRDVRFQTGTDEHGLKMAQKAREEGVDPATFADRMSAHFRDMAATFDISYDRFIRSSEPANHAAAQALWSAMEAAGDLYLGRYEGWYSIRDEAFYAEDELVAGDDGGKLSPQGTPVEWTVEESWFFRLSKYQQPLLDHIAAHPDFIRPESRRNEIVRFLEGGLNDLSVSRSSFDWGVKVPGSDRHVMYVWVDALVNYLTGLGYPDPDATDMRFWPANVHVIGKDIVRFHAIYWPAFLMSARVALPRQVYGHGFILNRGERMSKSSGNVVDPIELARRYGSDAVRHFLLREVRFGSDGTMSEEAIVTRANAELANNFGNLAQRTLSMIAKNCDGKVPAGAGEGEADRALLQAIDQARADMLGAMETLEINDALDALWRAMDAANLYIADQAPWSVRKTDPNRADAILATAHDAIRRLAILASWSIPAGAASVLDLVGADQSARSFSKLHQSVPCGTSLPVPTPAFPRLELVGVD